MRGKPQTVRRGWAESGIFSRHPEAQTQGPDAQTDCAGPDAQIGPVRFQVALLEAQGEHCGVAGRPSRDQTDYSGCLRRKPAARRLSKNKYINVVLRSIAVSQAFSFASMVIFAFSTREIGQPVSAAFAAASNLAGSAPGILAVTSR